MSDYEFKADAWAGLGLIERVERCQILNNEALMLADNADPNAAGAYRSLATAWMKLADAIGHEALKGNIAQTDNIPRSERMGSDATKAQPDNIPLSERMGSDATESQSDNVPLPERMGSDATEALHATIQKFSEASDRQARRMILLTYAILFLTVVMLFSVGVQIWLG